MLRMFVPLMTSFLIGRRNAKTLVVVVYVLFTEYMDQESYNVDEIRRY